MSYPCHYTNLCPHKPHKHAHKHKHTHTHTHTPTHTHKHKHKDKHTQSQTELKRDLLSALVSRTQAVSSRRWTGGNATLTLGTGMMLRLTRGVCQLTTLLQRSHNLQRTQSNHQCTAKPMCFHALLSSDVCLLLQ